MLAGAAVYVWHCDRDGNYSMYDGDAVDENYLRGVQEADEDGWVEFTTIFPGCYAGRWPHVHFEVYESLDAATSATNKLRTSQLAFPQDVCEKVYATEGYEESVANLAGVSLDTDGIFTRRLLAADGEGDRLGRRGLRRHPQRAHLTSLRSALAAAACVVRMSRVPSAQPAGDPAPEDGPLPDEALAEFGGEPFGLYVHVPFCTVRCGYCDFNTYTAEELGDAPGAVAVDVRRGGRSHEIRLARRVLGDRDVPVETVFFGGGTPTLLRPADLGAVLASAAAEFGLADDVEITTEANPDSVAAWDLEELRDGGLQPDLLRHAVGRRPRARHPRPHPRPVAGARPRSAGRGPAGFDEVSLDLIYGTPGESLADWETSAGRALACEPDHVSAYSLIVEEGTALARRVAPRRAADARRRRPRRQVPPRRRAARRRRARSGTRCPTGPRDPSQPVPAQPALLDRRPLVGRRPRRPLPRRRRAVVERQAPRGVRRPAGRRRSARRTAREVLGDARPPVERVLLEIRLRDGLPVAALDATGRGAGRPAGRARASSSSLAERLVLTRRGRLLADASCATCRLIVCRSEAVVTSTPAHFPGVRHDSERVGSAVTKSMSSSTRPSRAGSRSAKERDPAEDVLPGPGDVGLVAVRPAELLAGAVLPVDAPRARRASARCRAARA